MRPIFISFALFAFLTLAATAEAVRNSFEAFGYEKFILTDSEVLEEETIAVATEKALSYAQSKCGSEEAIRESDWTVDDVTIDLAIGKKVAAMFSCQ